MGVFLTSYFMLLAPAPAIAGWIQDRSGSPYLALVFAATLFGLTAISNLAFRILQRRLVI